MCVDPDPDDLQIPDPTGSGSTTLILTLVRKTRIYHFSCTPCIQIICLSTNFSVQPVDRNYTVYQLLSNYGIKLKVSNFGRLYSLHVVPTSETTDFHTIFRTSVVDPDPVFWGHPDSDPLSTKRPPLFKFSRYIIF